MDTHRTSLLLCHWDKTNRPTMKKLLPLVFAMLAVPAFAQVNFTGMNYQAVVRDANGEPLPNQTIGVRFELYSGLGGGGGAGYAERHTVSTNAQGLIDLVIGLGTPEPGSPIPTFGDIDWTINSPWNCEVSMDLAGGTNYSVVGDQQFRAVPFAQYARTADSLSTGVHWELVGNELQNTSGGPVRVMENMWVEGGVFLNNAVNFPGWDISGQTGSLTFNEQFQGPRLTLEPGGNVGVGTEFPDTTLHVVGALKVQDGSEAAGKVLTSDADGLASWQTPTGGGGHWVANGNDIHNANTGNVGIGITDPSVPLEVKALNGGNEPGIGLLSYNAVSTPTWGSGISFALNNSTNSKVTYGRIYGVVSDNTAGQEDGWLQLGHRLNGNMVYPLYLRDDEVGIGTSNPGSKLHVTNAANGITVVTNTTASGDTPLLVRSGNGAVEGLCVRANGNVGVGTTSPQSKLAVNGKITAKEVEVTLAGFPDYVFEADYDLMTLEEVEAYIQEHGHLPNVPSACEVEENGLGLGEMNKILLEKVEELTLHLIEQQKRLDEQAVMIQILSNR